MKTELSKYVDTGYLTRFLVLLFVLYYFNYTYCALVDDNGLLYSSLLSDHLNYVACIRKSILYTSNALNHSIGINSFVALPDYIKTVNGYYVQLYYACLGLGITSFWLAFVIADKQSLAKKIAWSVGGTIGLWIINVGRVTMLLIAHEHHWRINAYINHHDQFNLVAYTLIAFMAWLYLRSGKSPARKTRTAGFYPAGGKPAL